ncbi:MAG: DUF4136 domain-containing protein [Pseudomonadota bacterium]
MRARLLLSALVLVSACQSVSIDRDYDPTRDFAAYRSWSWQEPAVQFRPDDPRLDSDLTRQRIRQAVTEQLDQRGLRPAPNGTQADLKVQVWLIVDQREEQVSTQYGGGWGAPGWPGYWGGPGLIETRNLSYRVGTLQLDLLDARDGKLVWRGSAEQVQSERPQTPDERSALIRKTLARVLEHYPPR